MKALYRKWSGTAVIRLVTALTLFMFTALALNSCCRRHKLTYEDDEQAISLSVTSAGTKAVVDDLAGMVNQCFTGNNPDGGFGVYGYKKQVDQTSIKLFNNIRVYPANKITEQNATTTWSYTPIRYWDSNPVVSYQFIAYWPYISPETVTGTRVSVPDPVSNDYIDANKKLIIHEVPNWQPVNGTEVDYMTAAASGKYRTSVQNEAAAFNTGTVPFSFRHILSQLVIKAYYIGNNQETGDGVTVNSITLSRSADDLVLSNTLDGNTVKVTDFSQKYDESNATPLTPTSPTTNMAESCTLTLTQNGRIPHKDEISNVFTLGNQQPQPTAPVEIGRWLMVPHKWQALNLKANRTIGTAEPGDTDPVPVTIGESHYLYVTQPGTTYTITLMFDVSTGGITVGSIDIQDWTEQKTTHEVYNW